MKWICSTLLFSFATMAGAQTQFIPAGRVPSTNAIPWQNIVGVSHNALIPSGIPNRTTIFTTLNPGATAAQISSACNNCPSNQVVFLNAGIYYLNNLIDIGTPDFIHGDYFTLRGAGSGTNPAVDTILIWTNQTFTAVNIQIRGTDRWGNGYPNASDAPNYTNFILGVGTGYTQGSTNLNLNTPQTNILLGTHQALQAGTIITMDQLNDTFVNQVGQDGGFQTNSAALRLQGTRAQQQMFYVTSIANGTNLTVWPPVYMTNWQASLQPQIWWAGTSANQVGFENFTMNMYSNNAGNLFGMFFQSCWACWAKNIMFLDGPNKVWGTYNTLACEVRDSQFIDDQKLGSGSYGICPEISGAVLVENNWLWRISSMLLCDEGPVEGCVFAYNYCFQPWPSTNGLNSTQNAPAIEPHYVHGSMNLFEGNRANTLEFDFTHGSASHMTAFRNNLVGVENPAVAARTVEIVNIQATNRYMNFVGNVLGLGNGAFYTNYSDDITNADPSHNSTRTVYCTGYVDDGGSGTNFGDPAVLQTMLIHLNWDTVTTTNGGIVYAPTITNRTMLPSLYISGQPSWWTNWGAVVWPPIGSDLSPMTSKLPAQLSFEGADPIITVQPQNQTVNPPGTATFSVTASGNSPLSYQWSKNGTPVTGATLSTYTTPPTSLSDNGATFIVVVTDLAGSVTSSTATLTANGPATPTSLTIFQ